VAIFHLEMKPPSGLISVVAANGWPEDETGVHVPAIFWRISASLGGFDRCQANRIAMKSKTTTHPAITIFFIACE
jgi:hypothetical protein